MGLSAGIDGDPVRRPDAQDAAGGGLAAVNLQGLPAAGAASVLLAVAVLVLMLYLIKPRARRLVVPSILIWRLVLRARNPTPDRLRWWLSLLLAALIALAIALALVRPQLTAFGTQAR